jgi:hypothetical protein
MASQEDITSSSTSSFVAAIVTACITVGGCVAFWLVFHGRKSLRRVYQPRTVLEPKTISQFGQLPTQPIQWWHKIFTLDDKEVLYLNGPDAYFFLRFIKVFGLYLLVPYVFLTLVVCVPAS